MPIDRELLKGYIEKIVLSLLIREPMYGYLISKNITQLTNGQFDMKEPTLYVALKRLERSGDVIAYWEDAPARIMRKYYRLTPQGEAKVAQNRKDWIVFKQIMDCFLEGDS